MEVRPGWGLERSRVLQPVGQVELEFRRVGGREATSGKRKKTQAARGEKSQDGQAAGPHDVRTTSRGCPCLHARALPLGGDSAPLLCPPLPL